MKLNLEDARNRYFHLFGAKVSQFSMNFYFYWPSIELSTRFSDVATSNCNFQLLR